MKQTDNPAVNRVLKEVEREGAGMAAASYADFLILLIDALANEQTSAELLAIQEMVKRDRDTSGDDIPDDSDVLEDTDDLDGTGEEHDSDYGD